MIRLARVGARKQPYYRIVVIEKDRARNGRSIEVVGTYNPRTNPASVDLKHDRIAYWRSVGAQFSPIVEKLVAKNPGRRAPQAGAGRLASASALIPLRPPRSRTHGRRLPSLRAFRLLTAARCAADTMRAPIQASILHKFWIHPVRGKNMTQNHMVAPLSCRIGPRNCAGPGG